MRLRLALLATLALLGGIPLAGTAVAETATLTFVATADTYVTSAAPATAYGTSTSMRVDRNPTDTTYLRFDLSGLAGREVTAAALRLYQRNSSPRGGDVHLVSDTAWTEAMTFDTRAAVDGPRLAGFDAVEAGTVYDLALPGLAVADGPVALAVVGVDTDSSVWASRESKLGPPRLILEVSSSVPADGLAQVAPPSDGSSDPTYFGTNHRLAASSAGRLLTVFGRHGEGVQLAWRDPSGTWSTVTRGAVADGRMLGGTGTGDWSASIAVGRDRSGAEHAWVVMSGTNFTRVRTLQLRRLSELDSTAGPSVGPLVTLDAPALGDARPDVQAGPAGVAVTWDRRAGDTAFQHVTAWLDDPSSPSPALVGEAIHFTTTSSSRWGTLAVGTDGVTRNIVRSASGRLVQYTHAGGGWTAGANGPLIAGYPAAAALSGGETVVAVESDTAAHVTTVFRVAAGGTAAVALTLDGWAQPSVATDGASVWVVGVRSADGAVVSRRFDPALGWTAADDVEIDGATAGAASWPNARRDVQGRLQLVVRGPSGGTARHAVLLWQRAV